MTCPKCGKTMRRTGNGPFETPHYVKHYATHGVKHAMHGHPAMLLLSGGWWLAATVGNWMFASQSCPDCGHTS